MDLNTLKDLYIHELKDLYSAEKQLTRALPKMAKAASNAQLKEGFSQHLEETKEHVARLEKVLKGLDASTRGPKCKAMEGLVEEGADLMEEEGDPEVLDAGLIVAAQKVEHYEIAGYGSACTFAKLLGDKAGLELLKLTINEEETTDKKLTKLATSVINLQAAKE
jgi:ferritin-like metal-binding protein YciE